MEAPDEEQTMQIFKIAFMWLKNSVSQQSSEPWTAIEDMFRLFWFLRVHGLLDIFEG